MTEYKYIYDPNKIRDIFRQELTAFHRDLNCSRKLSANVTYLDIEEASEFLKISKHTLRKKAQKQEVPCFKRGRKWLFNQQDLIAFIEEGKRDTINTAHYDR